MKTLITAFLLVLPITSIAGDHCEMICRLEADLVKLKAKHQTLENHLRETGHSNLLPSPPSGEYRVALEQYNRWVKWEAEIGPKNCYGGLIFAKMQGGVALLHNNDKLFMPLGTFALKGVPPSLSNGQTYSGAVFPCGDYEYPLVGGKMKVVKFYAINLETALLEMESAWSKAQSK